MPAVASVVADSAVSESGRRGLSAELVVQRLVITSARLRCLANEVLAMRMR